MSALEQAIKDNEAGKPIQNGEAVLEEIRGLVVGEFDDNFVHEQWREIGEVVGRMVEDGDKEAEQVQRHTLPELSPAVDTDAPLPDIEPGDEPLPDIDFK